MRSSEPSGSVVPTPEAPHLLVVDDEPQIRELLAQALRREGYRVTTEADGRRALAVVQAEEVQVLLTDLRMPGITGLDLIRSAKQIRPDLGSVLLTAYASTETAVQALRFGADDYLPKPFRLEDLRAVVGRVLAARRMARDQRDASVRAHDEAEHLRRSERRARIDLERARADLDLSRHALQRRVRDLEFVRELTALLALEEEPRRVLETTASILAARFGARVVRLEADLGDGVVVAERHQGAGSLGALRALGTDLLRRAQRAPDGVQADLVLGDGLPQEAMAAVLRLDGRPSGGLTLVREALHGADDGEDRGLLALVPQALSVALEAAAGRQAARRSALQVATGILDALEQRGALPPGHSRRVAELAGRMCRQLETSERFAEVVTLAARLHDVGEVGLPEAALTREGPLTEGEREMLRLHPVVGARILAPFGEAAAYVRHHHERPDGRGYPDGLPQERIPLGAAIVGVAEAYDAMTSPRPWRAARTRGEALEEVERLRGAQFVPEAADALLALPVEAA
jgi:response regulator RpfG family c-di-GMP phosphodiesterase